MIVSRADDVAAVEVDLLVRRVDPLELAGHEDLGAETACLLECAAASSSPETPLGKPR